MLCALALSLAACSEAGNGSADGRPAQEASETAAVPEITTTTGLGAVRGRLGAGERRRVQDQVTRTVDGWLDAAYVGGDYPRSGTSGAFPGFTPPAAALARQDRAVLSNAMLAQRIDGVQVRIRRLVLDVLAVEGVAVGVTARVSLVMDLTGDVERRDRVFGRLLLSRTAGGGWRVFGYDMDRGQV